MSEAPPIAEIARLDLAFEPRPWAFATENRAAIEAHWRRLSEAKPALFNGRVLLLHRHAIEDGVFRGAYLEIDYASFMAWRDFGFPDAGMHNCFSMAALQAADGAFLLGEMAAHTANAGAVYFAAGTPDPTDIVGDTVDLEASVLRELAEETGLDPASLDIAPGWTMVAIGPRIAMIRRMRSSLDSGALKAKVEAYLASEAQPELARMHVVRDGRDMPSAMPEFQRAYLAHALRDGRSISPDSHGATASTR